MNKQKSISLLDIQIINKVVFPTASLVVIYGHTENNLIDSQKDLIFLPDRSALIEFSESVQVPFSIVNYANQPLTRLEHHPLLKGIIDVSKIKRSTYSPYLFINNPDGSIRWFFPKKNQRPSFLNLYNGSGWKSKAFVLASKMLSKLNKLSTLCDGQFSIFHKDEHFISSSFPDIAYDEMAVFTGTIGENRKAIISLSQKGLGSQFIKIPLTEAALALVNNEKKQLSLLSKFDYTATVIPEVKQKSDQIMVSNISPDQKNKNQSWSEIHWNSLEEFYQHSYKLKPLKTTPFWDTIMDGMAFLNRPFTIKNGLSEKQIQLLKTKVTEIFKAIDPSSLVPIGIGHGDFTPWNMYVGKDKLHVYDWEMSQSDFPLLFDFFHYFFQKGILINKDEYSTIWNDLQKQLESKKVQEIVENYSIDQSKHFQLYLLYMVCYYLPKYIAQPTLHDQVHWLLSTWLEAAQIIETETEPSLNFSHF